MKLYTVDEVAKLLSVAPKTIQTWTQTGQLQALQLGTGKGRGSRVRITEQQLQDFLAKGAELKAARIRPA